MTSQPIICVTPTRNESWIIRHFVAAATRWADRVIVVDQCSTDGTRDILATAPRVQLVKNDSPVYDEAFRQRLLLQHARAIPGQRILLGLDADEALSANWATSGDWQRILAAKPGTIIRFRWANILPGFERAWVRPEYVPFGFVDDGSEHNGTRIHSARVPQPANAPTVDLDEIVVLHFQYVVWERMVSKQRWYQAWELTQHGRKGPLDIYRQYNHMNGSWHQNELQPVKPEWFSGYENAEIRFRELTPEPLTWWDRELVQMLCTHGPERFRRLAIWDHDWTAVATRAGLQAPDLRDPRSVIEKTVHRLLSLTQSRRGNWSVRGLERALRLAGW